LELNEKDTQQGVVISDYIFGKWIECNVQASCALFYQWIHGTMTMKYTKEEEKFLKVFLLIIKFEGFPAFFRTEQMYEQYIKVSHLFFDYKYHNMTFTRSMGVYQFFIDANEVPNVNKMLLDYSKDYDDENLDDIKNDYTTSMDLNIEPDIPLVKNSHTWNYCLDQEEIRLLVEFLTTPINDYH